jgi:hypothetical protein
MQVRIEKDIRKPLKASAKKNARSLPKEASRLLREKLKQENMIQAEKCTS